MWWTRNEGGQYRGPYSAMIGIRLSRFLNNYILGIAIVFVMGTILWPAWTPEHVRNFAFGLETAPQTAIFWFAATLGPLMAAGTAFEAVACWVSGLVMRSVDALRVQFPYYASVCRDDANASRQRRVSSAAWAAQTALPHTWSFVEDTQLRGIFSFCWALLLPLIELALVRRQLAIDWDLPHFASVHAILALGALALGAWGLQELNEVHHRRHSLAAWRHAERPTYSDLFPPLPDP